MDDMWLGYEDEPDDAFVRNKLFDLRRAVVDAEKQETVLREAHKQSLALLDAAELKALKARAALTDFAFKGTYT